LHEAHSGRVRRWFAAVTTNQIDGVLYDRLLAITSEGKIGPALAESWQATADSATFKLKPNAVCVDGTKLTIPTAPRTASGAVVKDWCFTSPAVVRRCG
jgi:ABC-type transport system substrate-binding protein